jgi:hypothetical protein
VCVRVRAAGPVQGVQAALCFDTPIIHQAGEVLGSGHFLLTHIQSPQQKVSVAPVPLVCYDTMQRN